MQRDVTLRFFFYPRTPMSPLGWCRLSWGKAAVSKNAKFVALESGKSFAFRPDYLNSASTISGWANTSAKESMLSADAPRPCSMITAALAHLSGAPDVEISALIMRPP